MDGFELAILLTAAGAATGGVLIKTLISAGKQIGWLPETGRALLYAAGILAAGLMSLAVWDAGTFSDGVDPQSILMVLLSWFGLYTAAVGTHETFAKAQRMISGETNPKGPDAP